MDDLRRRFAALDRLPAPDVWSDVERRVEVLRTATSALQPAGVSWRGMARPGGHRRGMPALLAILLIGALLALLVGGLFAGSLRLDDARRTRDEAKEDWPGPVRTEPAGGAGTVANEVPPPGRDSRTEFYVGDAAGEPVFTAFPQIDIASLRSSGADDSGMTAFRVSIDLAMPRAPLVPAPDPSKQRVGYGLVLDQNGDGVGDLRVGLDNIRVGLDNIGQPEHREWITDLATGATVASIGDYGTGAMGTSIDTYFPSDGRFGANEAVIFLQGADVRVYAWASVIEDGRVLATDYAPDVGWLHLRPEPSPTSAPLGP